VTGAGYAVGSVMPAEHRRSTRCTRRSRCASPRSSHRSVCRLTRLYGRSATGTIVETGRIMRAISPRAAAGARGFVEQLSTSARPLADRS